MKLFRNLFGRQAKEETVPPQLPEIQGSAQAALHEGESPVTAPIAPLQTRPLPPPKAFSSPTRRIRYGQASDVGQVRGNNQDACLSILASVELAGNPPPIGLFIVADGMGGHHDGEQASAVTVQTVASHVISEIIQPHLEGREPSSEQKTILEVLDEAVSAANSAVQARVPNSGTTATCAVVRGDLAYIAHVGDSRAYLYAENNLELITRDHSLVRRLQELGQLTAEEAENYPQRNVLYRAIGQGDSLEVDTVTRRLPPSSSLLLCSDGLWGVLKDERIVEILASFDDPQKACEQMISAANANGGPDNITAILVRMPD